MRNGSRAALACLLPPCLFLAVLAGCGQNAALESPASPSGVTRPATAFRLRVEVFAPSGQPLPGASVRVTGPTGSAPSLSIRTVGTVHEVAVPVPGVVTLRVAVRGYEPVEKDFIVTSDAQLDLTLTRARRDSS